MIFLYNLLNLLILPLYFVILIFRIFKQKDNALSVIQRLCLSIPSRPQGKLIWLNAASVGESMVAITLVKALKKSHPKVNFLVTTGTLSSAGILKTWLPKGVNHQFTPLDNIITVRRFLNNWKIDLGIFIESEFWPCLITESAKRFNLLLVNARLSNKSYSRWLKQKWIFQLLAKKFKNIIVQSNSDLDKYKALGSSKVKNLGNLKFANKELEVDKRKLSALEKLFKDKKIFVISSTHKEDEEVALDIIHKFKQEKIDYYPIIILRHPERRDEIKNQCRKLGFKFSIRSNSSKPSLDDDLYIVDSFGELGLFYSLAFMVFVGGSFKRGGHNLLEPAYFDNIIILGPDMSNFQNIADDMISCSAAIQIRDADSLASTIRFFLNDKDSPKGMEFSKNARKFVDNRARVLENYISEINKFIKAI